jgi:hypothetical protein
MEDDRTYYARRAAAERRAAELAADEIARSRHLELEKLLIRLSGRQGARTSAAAAGNRKSAR